MRNISIIIDVIKLTFVITGKHIGRKTSFVVEGVGFKNNLHHIKHLNSV